MSITADYHMHSSFSGDSKTPMEEMILTGISKGLSRMCFTEHNDFDHPVSEDIPKDSMLLNPDSYLHDLLHYKEKYKDKIDVLFGVELGLQPHVTKETTDFAKAHDYDFIIASSHACHRKDPYLLSFYEGRTQEEAYLEYFESILENLGLYSDFDVYGHLDYVVRYGPKKDEGYSSEQSKSILDTILQKLISSGKGIEINTGGLKYGIRDMNPCQDILRRYKELGGEIITVGSDAHTPDQIATSFDRAEEALSACGFRYYCTFEKRMPAFHKLS